MLDFKGKTDAVIPIHAVDVVVPMDRIRLPVCRNQCTQITADRDVILRIDAVSRTNLNLVMSKSLPYSHSVT